MLKKKKDPFRPPRDKRAELKWRLYVLLGIFVYFVAINQIIHIRPDHAFLALIVFAVTFSKGRGKQFLIDWMPFILYWVAYDMMRGIADSVRDTINVVPPFELELKLFGSWFHGQVPAHYFEYFQRMNEGRWFKVALDVMGANFYTLHFGAPLILGWVFWHTTNDRPLFYKFVYTLTVLNIMALTTFMLYPAAPPWYVYKYGLIQPAGQVQGSAGGLINFDALIGRNFLQSFWDTFNANLYAAIPSLHGAYPCAIAYFGMKKFRKFRPLWILYPVGTWFSAVYLDEHYIIDLLIGLGYLAVAYQVSKGVLYPKVFRRFVERKKEAGPAMPKKGRRRKRLNAMP
ncbi:inositol phosphorylceramide synthase [bacterium]|nr:inositol phosphorylceramide synthase [bacterium]